MNFHYENWSQVWFLIFGKLFLHFGVLISFIFVLSFYLLCLLQLSFRGSGVMLHKNISYTDCIAYGTGYVFANLSPSCFLCFICLHVFFPYFWKEVQSLWIFSFSFFISFMSYFLQIIDLLPKWQIAGIRKCFFDSLWLSVYTVWDVSFSSALFSCLFMLVSTFWLTANASCGVWLIQK